MDSDIKLENFRHASNVRTQLNLVEDLPFSQILSSESIVKALVEHNIEFRKRIFSPDLTLWTLLSQVLNEDQSCQAAVARVIAFLAQQGEVVPSANTAAYCNARSRLPEEMLSMITRQCGKELEEQTPAKWLWNNRHVKLLDGSGVSMPDTKENQAEYPQSKSQKPGVGFPAARLVAVISCANGALLDLGLAAQQGAGTGEHGITRQLLHNFQAGDIILADRYYGSFWLIHSLMQQGVDVVFPMHRSRDYDFRSGKRLGKKDHLACWLKPNRPTWMDKETYDSFPNEIWLRELEVELTRRGFPSKTRTLVTTFLDPKKYSKSTLSELYDFRWFVEVDLRSIKQTMRMDILRGKTPQMVRKEIWAHLLAYNLIRKVMAQAAVRHNKTIRQLSFKLTLQVLEAFRQLGLFCESNKTIYIQMLAVIAYKTVGNRPGRSEPRLVKRRPKRFFRMQKPRSQYQRAA